MGVTVCADGRFVPIRSGDICPVCHQNGVPFSKVKDGRCSVFINNRGERAFYRCKHVQSNRPSKGWYIHLARDIDGVVSKVKAPAILPSIPKEQEVTPQVIELRDKVYRRFRELVKEFEGAYLYEKDMQDLTRRGLTTEQIEKMQFFSVPTSEKKVWSKDGNYKVKVSTAISRELFKQFGVELLKVPGFIKLKDKNGNEFITFKTRIKNPNKQKYQLVSGYFIPYQDIHGQIPAMQFRLTEPIYDEKGKLLRYFWYSSSQARSGSPIDYYAPSSVARNDILLVTEGALKGRIACEIARCEGMFEAGVSNYRALVKSIVALENIKGIKYKILLALDMDKSDNEEVLAAEEETIKLLKETGHQVALVSWDRKFKGIDDALINKCKLSYQVK